MELIQVFWKLTIEFVLLFFLIRIVGQKIMGQFTPFHFIAAFMLSELLGNAVYKSDVSTIEIIYTIVFWGALLFILEYIFSKVFIFTAKIGRESGDH